MPKINLAQETMRNEAVARRRKIIYAISGGILLLVVAIYFSSYFLIKNVEGKINDVNLRISSLESQLRNREPGGKEIKAFSSRLVNMKNLLNNHTRWSQVLAELERLFLPNVIVETLKGGTEKNIVTIKVNAPTIEAAADLIVSLQNEVSKNETNFKDVVASSLSAIKNPDQSSKGGGFSTILNLNVKPEAFKEATPAPVALTPLTS